MEEMEYTTLPQVAERLEDRWEDLGERAAPKKNLKRAAVVDD